MYLKVLCKPSDATKMEGRMIITFKSFKGYKLLTASSYCPGFLVFYCNRRNYFIILHYNQEASMFSIYHPVTNQENEENPCF
jgi:hypothetical protein